ncbi:hypothetical protein T06_6279 [Trichinella sp. T6]|nr:hypothetical protein T06_10391 [Trichinella sp. T6]KRX62085.1 hypothetical protein T06_6279 [Trichinella sp. T6]
MDDCFSRGRVFIRDSAAYTDQQRLAAAVTYRLHRNEISAEHFSSAVSYHTPAPAPIVAKSRNVSVQSSLLISTDMKK